VSETEDKPSTGQEAVNGSMRPGAQSVRPAPEPVGEEPAADAAGEGVVAAQAPADGGAPKNAELEKAQADAAKYKDQLLRTAADFDNFRKRTRRELEEAQRKGLEKALLELLPVADNLERAVSASQSATDVQSIVEGVRMVLRFYEDALGRLGVEKVPSVGQPFDPGLHEAVQQVASDAPVGTVVTEMAPGYKLGGKLLRPAVVAVAVPRPAGDGAAPDASGGSDGVAEPPQN
jgi:molecular chaperone GrpE